MKSTTIVKPIFYLVCVLVMLGLVRSSFAFRYYECLGEKLKWNSNTITLRASPISFPTGEWRNALNEAVARWNHNPSRFGLILTTDSGGVGFDNGQNEVWFTSDDSILGGAPARAMWWYTCYWFFGDHVSMDEVDIFFDNRVPYTPSTQKSSLWNYGGSRRPFQTTACHELGHTLPLAHVNTEYNIMGQDWTHIHVNGSRARAYAGEDAADGAVFLYGLRSPKREDLGVVHWMYEGTSDEYSTHQKTRLYNSSGAVLPSVMDGGEARYRVSRGQRVQVEFSYENNGASLQSGVRVGYYLSTNHLITTQDRRIGGATFTLGRGSVYTTRIGVTVPSNATPGRNYWLGVIIDEEDNVSEVNESNNATYIPIRTTFLVPPIDIRPLPLLEKE